MNGLKQYEKYPEHDYEFYLVDAIERPSIYNCVQQNQKRFVGIVCELNHEEGKIIISEINSFDSKEEAEKWYDGWLFLKDATRNS